jgi:uroporphyrinogen-III decarboxylase
VVEEDGRLLETDPSGRRLGQIDLSGGLATHLDRADTFRLDGLSHVAFHTSRQHAQPLVKDLADVERMVVPQKSFYKSAGYGDFVAQVQAYAGDRVGLCGDCDSATLAFSVSLRGMHQALLDLMDAPRLVHAMMDKGVACAIERGKFFIDAGVRILRLNDSVANMSVISPGTWKEFILPRMKTVCDELHGYADGVRIYCHICGNVLPIVDLLLEAGLDCIGPLDPLGGFTVADVRRRAGDEVVLMGGVNTLSFVQSTPEEIQAEALRCIQEGDRNGRFILGSGCALPGESRPENIEALTAAAEAYSRGGR